MRRLWRWLTGRTLKDAVPSWNIPTREAYLIDLGSDGQDLRGAEVWGLPGWEYAVTRDILSDDLYQRVTAQRKGLADLTDTLHDSTMMARIDKGRQEELGRHLSEIIAEQEAMARQAEADRQSSWAKWRRQYEEEMRLPPPEWDGDDPYVWHDLGELIELARHV